MPRWYSCEQSPVLGHSAVTGHLYLASFCCEQLKSAQGMKVSTGDAAADVYEDDALVDTDSRTKLEQLVQMLHKEAEVSRWFFLKICPSLCYVNIRLHLPNQLQDINCI